jgi:hypothetical protein
MSLSRIQQFGSSLILAGIIAGCGGSDTGATSPQATAVVPEQTVEASGGVAVKTAGLTTAIESPARSTADDGAKSTATNSSTAKLSFPDDEATKTLQEIQQLRIAPVPGDVEQARTARRERNERIITMATNVLRLTMNDESRKPQFHQAIGQLLEARFQMALSGTREDVDLLYADVQALNDRDPKSIAAAEGVYYIARFAHTQAGLSGRSQPVWFETLSRWAREFADRFPEQSQRAVSLLFGAGRSCELHAVATSDTELAARLMTECKLCYTALAQKFPTTEQGQEATASLRRLALPGQQLSQFSGPTADGGFVSADEFPGKPTLIYFWDSESEEFEKEVLPLLVKVRSEVGSDRLRIIGVALDEDESTMNSFMETHDVPGLQIFFPNPEQRSWNSPLIRFWGVAKCPSIWLVDANGKVTTTTAATSDLSQKLQSLLKKP